LSKAHALFNGAAIQRAKERGRKLLAALVHRRLIIIILRTPELRGAVEATSSCV
jgi:hypothetical protein